MILDLNLQVRNFLYKHDPNSVKYFDGDILQQICIFITYDNATWQQKWLSRLSKSKQDYIKHLEIQSEKFLDNLNTLILFADL